MTTESWPVPNDSPKAMRLQNSMVATAKGMRPMANTKMVCVGVKANKGSTEATTSVGGAASVMASVVVTKEEEAIAFDHVLLAAFHKAVLLPWSISCLICGGKRNILGAADDESKVFFDTSRQRAVKEAQGATRNERATRQSKNLVQFMIVDR